MRSVKNRQLRLGVTDIAAIKFDARSRDDVPQVLRGLQYIYVTEEVRTKVFALLEGLLPDHINPNKGRAGMDLWNVLVLATLRVNLNWDYDRLLEMVNNHRTIRQMLGHGTFDDDYQYKLQTIKDNVNLLTVPVLEQINQIVVNSGHSLIKKKEPTLSARCDSFVVESPIHYPTDINLLFDAVRCSIRVMAQMCEAHGDSRWRQYKYHTRQIKNAYRKAQTLKHSTSKDPAKKAARKQAVMEAHAAYLSLSARLLVRITETLETLNHDQESIPSHLTRWIGYGWHQIDLIRRRVIEGEKIPHHEKIFSIFEDYSEWISKGKAGVAVELGLNVCVMECSHGFILHHMVMQHCVDKDIAVEMVQKTKERFPHLSCCSFDKGFHSPDNQKQLAELIDKVVLPRKGRLSKEDQAREQAPEFVKARRQHSAVESGINALEVHGLDRCPDRTFEHFERYVALAVVGRNLQKIGAILQASALKQLQKQKQKQRSQNQAA